MNNRTIKLAFLIFAAVSLVALIGARVYSRAQPGSLERSGEGAVEISGRAPGFVLPMMEGGEASISALKGSWVLVHFWATWCVSCVREIPLLARFARDPAVAALKVVAVSVDESMDTVRSFFPHGTPPFAVALDPSAATARAYGTTKYPETYLVDPSGELRLKFIGPQEWTDGRAGEQIGRWIGAAQQ
ncbi:MAG: TlpA disulfide reductase family protein [Myxococcota bacterium]